MRSQRGFLYYDAGRDRYGIDWRESLSIIVGEALLKEILASRRYMRGRLLDVGCGKRPYALIYDPLVARCSARILTKTGKPAGRFFDVRVFSGGKTLMLTTVENITSLRSPFLKY